MDADWCAGNHNEPEKAPLYQSCVDH